MKKISVLLSAATALLLVSCSDSNPVLTVEGGQVQGVPTPTEGVIAYKGIPFAAPPLGDLRWKEPQPVVPWEGVKVADTYGAAALQTPWDPESFYGREWRASGSVPLSEDCLYLNVWTPAAGKKGEKLPVAIWIHGGGYREGFAFEPEMDGGEAWAKRGVILVTVTYRLGSIGFFSHPLLSAESPNSVSGNYGLMDQIAAVKWVRNNIEQFGGDPGNITIFGQSAGAGSVQSLSASPLSRDLISKTISMSGGGLSTARPGMPLDTAALANKMMMDHFGITTLEQMRALPFDTLRKMSADYTAATGKRVSWSPVVDNYVLNNTFSQTALAGEIADIPYMFGYTANDMNDATQAIADFCSLRAEKSSKPVYAYLFTRQLPGDENGAFHSADLWYVFNSFKHSWRPFTEGDKQLSENIVDFWTNFAKYGNPNGNTDGAWTVFTKDNPAFMVLDADEEKSVLNMTTTPKFIGPSPRK